MICTITFAAIMRSLSCSFGALWLTSIALLLAPAELKSLSVKDDSVYPADFTYLTKFCFGKVTEIVRMLGLNIARALTPIKSWCRGKERSSSGSRRACSMESTILSFTWTR